MCRDGKQSPPCANGGPLVEVFNKRHHYQCNSLPACAGTQIRAFVSVLGKIHEGCISGTWSYPYLAGVAVDLYFL